MDLEDLKIKILDFERQAGFDKTQFDELVGMLQKELDILKSNPDKPDVVKHQLIDLLVLIVQIGNRHDVDFDAELSTWFKKSQRYLEHSE